MSGAIWQRLRQHGRRIGSDPRLVTELGRLNWFGELTGVQVAAGLRIAQIYTRYERLKRLARSARSPSYEPGFGDPDIAEDRLAPDQLEDLEEDNRDATAKFRELQKQIPSDLRSPVESLCVEDRNINPVILTRVRTLLDQLAVYWGITTKNRSKRPTTPSSASEAEVVKRVNFDRMCWFEVLRRTFPHLSDKQISHIIATHRALVDRRRFQAEKRGKR
jgi:hypothetical protein